MFRSYVGRALAAGILVLCAPGVGHAALPAPAVAGLGNFGSAPLEQQGCDLGVFWGSGTGEALFFGALEGHDVLAAIYLPGYFCGKRQGNVPAFDTEVFFAKDAHLTAYGACYFGGTWNVSPGPLPGMARITLALKANFCETAPPAIEYNKPNVSAKFVIKVNATTATNADVALY